MFRSKENTKMKKTNSVQREKSAGKTNLKARDYKYSTLESCDAGSDDLFHFYATIIDATFPHRVGSGGRYCCSIKIADPSCQINDAGEIESCTLVLFAK